MTSDVNPLDTFILPDIDRGFSQSTNRSKKIQMDANSFYKLLYVSNGIKYWLLIYYDDHSYLNIAKKVQKHEHYQADISFGVLQYLAQATEDVLLLSMFYEMHDTARTVRVLNVLCQQRTQGWRGCNALIWHLVHQGGTLCVQILACHWLVKNYMHTVIR